MIRKMKYVSFLGEKDSTLGIRSGLLTSKGTVIL